jgi:hypothetical protein
MRDARTRIALSSYIPLFYVANLTLGTETANREPLPRTAVFYA